MLAATFAMTESAFEDPVLAAIIIDRFEDWKWVLGEWSGDGKMRWSSRGLVVVNGLE